MRTPKGNGGWFSGDKNMKGAAQETYQLYCALNLCYEWMQVVIKFGLDFKLDSKKLNHHAPLMLDVISHFIEKNADAKGAAVNAHNKLLDASSKFGTAVAGIDIYKMKTKHLTPMQLAQQMYNAHIYCSNNLLELEAGTYVEWKSEKLQVKMRGGEEEGAQVVDIQKTLNKCIWPSIVLESNNLV